jgi:protein ImuB
VELEHPVVLLEPLAFLLNRMLEPICARLAARALATQEVRLELQLDQGWNEELSSGRPTWTGEDACRPTKFFQRSLRLPVSLLDAKVFLKLLQLELNAHPPGAPISGIRLSAEPARPRAGQGGLFLPPTPEPEKLELTLARITGIVGEGKAGSVELLDTHHPESFRMQRFGIIGPQALKPIAKRMHRAALKALRHPTATKESVPSQTLRSSPAGTPNSAATNAEADSNNLVTALRIFRPPVRAIVTVRHGKPVQLECPKKKEVRGEILWAAGPWRSSGDWWDQEPWSRDEWDIAVQGECGIALYRLVRDLLNGKWMVEGVYD